MPFFSMHRDIRRPGAWSGSAVAAAATVAAPPANVANGGVRRHR